MSNMRYCRFTNTFGDLEECYDALTAGEELSEEEADYARRIIDLCHDIVSDSRAGIFPTIEGDQS